jgi:hypothetical protein
VHTLLAKLAVEVDAGHVLSANDRAKLPAEQEKTADVLALSDLRNAS